MPDYEHNPYVEEVVGRYITLSIDGVDNRVYFEESGSGTPLVCLHTAGSDSRQYRHLLADEAVTERFRVLAFDLPWHGKSLPPAGWWEQEYLLTTDRYIETVLAFCDRLELESPVVLGCSMAGSLVLELARTHADRFTGVIGLSGASTVKGRFHDWPLAPDVNSNQVVPSWVSGLMSPTSPEESRREVWWEYSQGGPGIYRGDTYFYSNDLDLRGKEHEIDTVKCSVHLLTGEYDYACTADETEATIAAIPGATGGRMTDIGHFPVSENYPKFREYLLPALRDIDSRRADSTH
ncbi:alpha/beta hydrolase [Rhodococcus sp. B10]|uniref:alpha/beta fold hydrolase n=1 Tax=Rhodococcus sp. B10 TaxID=2695876 RepID=UPI00142FBAE2|nr:alpha/beta hydrolase [Rhodococcus sp. B10]NIL77308.1 2-succinyl-6-hydroxy-2,4-cyclohexadiene-1-carboxylate synthase [Rhodococcus sp. B10]